MLLPREEPLTMVICPLGDDCLGHGPTCLAVYAAIWRIALYAFAYAY